jgi:hypothetical protein
MRVPGFVEQEGGANQCNIIFAIPCSVSGEIDSETQAEYEEFADERFAGCNRSIPRRNRRICRFFSLSG